MQYNSESLEKLVDQFARFPGIGRKGATRMAYQVLNMTDQEARDLAQAVLDAKTKLHRCRICQDYTENDLCRICASNRRDKSTICVVETPGISRRWSGPMSTGAPTMCFMGSSAPWTASAQTSSV